MYVDVEDDSMLPSFNNVLSVHVGNTKNIRDMGVLEVYHYIIKIHLTTLNVFFCMRINIDSKFC